MYARVTEMFDIKIAKLTAVLLPNIRWLGKNQGNECMKRGLNAKALLYRSGTHKAMEMPRVFLSLLAISGNNHPVQRHNDN